MQAKFCIEVSRNIFRVRHMLAKFKIEEITISIKNCFVKCMNLVINFKGYWPIHSIQI
jgi:hypothetical protein